MGLWIVISSVILALIILIPISIKGNIDKSLSIPSATLVGLLSGAIIYLIMMFRNLWPYQIIILQIFFIFLISGIIILWRFFRDPDRIPPGDENDILSPADGKVIYVKRIEKGKIPFSEKNGKKFSLKDYIQTDTLWNGGYLIGIEMTVLDVHVNRAPITGKINLLKLIKGKFLSMKREEAIIQNERAIIVVENEHLKLGVVQIATRLVRSIISYIQEGEKVNRGDRIGMIRFGSQVDVILPERPPLRITVKPGEQVMAGLSIIAINKQI